MNIEKLIENYVGKSVRDRMEGTLPYQFAEFINRLLYTAVEEGSLIKVEDRLWVNVPKYGLKEPIVKYAGLDEKGEYAQTARTLREIHDFLLGLALKEVTK